MASTPEDSEAARRRRELETSIEARVKQVEQEHERLLGLSKQVASMEVVNAKGIEQLRQEIVKVNGELEGESSRLKAAQTRLSDATATLREQQEVKAALSERLMEVLLESESTAEQRLKSVEEDLKALGAPGGGGGGPTSPPVGPDQG